jgi:hypothetical protein
MANAWDDPGLGAANTNADNLPWEHVAGKAIELRYVYIPYIPMLSVT